MTRQGTCHTTRHGAARAQDCTTAQHQAEHSEVEHERQGRAAHVRGHHISLLAEAGESCSVSSHGSVHALPCRPRHHMLATLAHPPTESTATPGSFSDGLR